MQGWSIEGPKYIPPTPGTRGTPKGSEGGEPGQGEKGLITTTPDAPRVRPVISCKPMKGVEIK